MNLIKFIAILLLMVMGTANVNGQSSQVVKSDNMNTLESEVKQNTADFYMFRIESSKAASVKSALTSDTSISEYGTQDYKGNTTFLAKASSESTSSSSLSDMIFSATGVRVTVFKQ